MPCIWRISEKSEPVAFDRLRFFRLRDARRDGNMKNTIEKRSTAMYENHIADISLAPEGEKKIRWAAGHMPVLAAIAEDFRET